MKTIEKDLVNLLNTLAHEEMTAEKLKNSGKLYEQFGQTASDWMRDVALRRYKSMLEIHSDGSYEEAVDDCAMKAIKELEQILALPEHSRIKYMMVMASHTLIDSVRDKGKNRIVYIENGKEVLKNQHISLNEDWGQELEEQFNSGDNVVNHIIAEESMLDVNCESLRAMSFFRELPRFDVVSLVGTKVVKIKNSTLAAAIDKEGLLRVSEWVFEELMNQCRLNLQHDFFTSSFKHDRIPPYKTVENLSEQVSKHSYACARTLKRKMGKCRCVLE